MLINRRAFLKTSGAMTGVATLPALAQSYPSRPVTIVVPFPAGGGTDATIRILAEGFQKQTGRSMLVENRPGGGTLIALNYLAQQKPDGYTLGVMTRAQFATYWVANASNAVHPLNDITFIAATHGSIFGLLVRADGPHKSLADVVAAAKANPGKLSVGNIGIGTTHHLTALEFAREAGIELNHIPYKGEAESTASLIGGHIDLAVSSGTFIPHVESGRLRVLALALPARLSKYPQWPTFTEQGFPVQMETSVGIGGPKGMDPSVVRYLADALRRITQAPEVVAGLERLYQPVQYIDTDTYNRGVQQRYQLERELVERYNLRQKT